MNRKRYRAAAEMRVRRALRRNGFFLERSRTIAGGATSGMFFIRTDVGEVLSPVDFHPVTPRSSARVAHVARVFDDVAQAGMSLDDAIATAQRIIAEKDAAQQELFRSAVV